MAQSFGLPRSIGQIYAYLYFSPQPRGLADIRSALGISKGSASMGVRQLEQWQAARKIWIRGDRRDYYEANEWIGQILRNALLDTIGTRMSSYQTLLDDVAAELEGASADEEASFVRVRVAGMKKFHDKVVGVWNSPIMKALTK